MQKYQNILFVSTGIQDKTEALKQALSLARNNQADLTALIISPKFPSNLAEHEKKYQQTLKEDLLSAIHKVGAAIGFDTNSLKVVIETETKIKPAISIIKRVLKGSIDLVIKQSEQIDSEKGFKALDMNLLRLCPCPLWLCRPIASPRQNIKIAVAIDAESETEEGRDLSIQLLQVADLLAKDCSNTINIVSCWVYEFEDYLKHNAWSPLPEDKITQIVAGLQEKSFSALSSLIKEANIGSKTDIHHIKGQPDELIPQYIEDYDIDILVMGTVARSGILNFIIGNTAENILQKINCSLLAMKPKGYISPIKAY